MSHPTVCFPEGETGSSLLHGALEAAVRAHPTAFAGFDLPDRQTTRKRLPDVMVRFEARRAASPHRVDLARLLSSYVAERTMWGDEPLAEAIEAGDPGERAEQAGEAAPGWVPALDYRGQRWEGAAIAALADRLRADHQLTTAAADALKWVARELLQAPVDLTGHTFALLGAGAELAPTTYLLQAGARVLWVDRQAPTLAPSRFAGTLVHYEGAGDLLMQPGAIREAVAREAAQSEVHLGLFAYAPGKGRELLLTAAMNGIAAATEPASVAMLVSPTTPGEVQPEDRVDRATRRAQAPRWQRALARARVLAEPSYEAVGDVQIAKSIVPLQGPTYLAAQYLAKMMAAEAWVADRAPLRVSSNVAGITHTKSLEHPLFLAGFRGGPTFGVEIFTPEQTRVLTTLLMLHDVLRPDAPGACADGGPCAQARRMAAQSIHGGVRSAPFVLDHTIRVAAVVGLGKEPSLLLKLRGA